MRNTPKEMLAAAKQIRKAVKWLRTKTVINRLIHRGVAPDKIERTIHDAEVAADAITDKARLWTAPH
jgi:hypothetical protein